MVAKKSFAEVEQEVQKWFGTKFKLVKYVSAHKMTLFCTLHNHEFPTNFKNMRCSGANGGGGGCPRCKKAPSRSIVRTARCIKCKEMYTSTRHNMCDPCFKTEKERKRLMQEGRDHTKSCIHQPCPNSAAPGKEWCSKHESKMIDIRNGKKNCKRHGCPEKLEISSESIYCEEHKMELRKDKYKNLDVYRKRLDKEADSITRKLRTYKSNATKRELVWGLTDDEALNLLDTPCYYCGEIEKRKKDCGIDRIDSNGDYVMKNVVSCCSACNMMKGVWETESFVALCGHISSFKSNLSEPFVLRDLDSSISGSFSDYRSSTKSKRKKVEEKIIKLKNEGLEPTPTLLSRLEKRKFSLTNEEFQNIVKNPCYLCGKVNVHKVHQNGIDRVDAKRGYEIDNTRSCCTSCNTMKRDTPLDDFLRKCLKVYQTHGKDIRVEVLTKCKEIKN